MSGHTSWRLLKRKYCTPEKEMANGWTRWIQPIRKGYRLQCCDCKLIHVVEFRVRKQRAQFRAQREKRSPR